jgi:hypothetical protein
MCSGSISAITIDKTLTEKYPTSGAYSAYLSNTVQVKKILDILYSIDTKTMECGGCPQHFKSVRVPRRGSDSGIMTIDQSLPPILPSQSELNCIKIARLESGSQANLAEAG